MERLHILGTGNAMVTKCYNTCFAVSNKNQYFLVDAGGGNGILRQLKGVGIAIEDIPYIFVSHCHIDHIMGVIWLIRAYSAKATKNPDITHLTIYGHEEVIHILKTMMTLLLNKKQSESLKGRLHLDEIVDGQKVSAMNFQIEFIDILSTKDKQFGCRFDLPSGISLMFLGDEPYKVHEAALAEEVDYLLHEAFCLYADRDVYEPYKKHHCTVKEACDNAGSLKVGKLVLYHTEDDRIRDRKDLYVREGSHFFDGKIYVPNDLETIELVKAGEK